MKLNRKMIRNAAILCTVFTSVVLLGSCEGLLQGSPSADQPLTGVTLAGTTLSPAFDPAITQYAATVPNTTEQVNVSLAGDDSDHSFIVNGTAVIPGQTTATVALNVGDNDILIVVSDGAESITYTVTVERLAAPEIVVTGPKTAGGSNEDLSSGDTIDFGTTSLSNPTSEIIFTIENSGTSTLTLTATPNYIVITDNVTGFYGVSAQPSSGTIPPNGTESFTVRLDPMGGTDTYTARVVIANDDDDENDFELLLTGVGN